MHAPTVYLAHLPDTPPQDTLDRIEHDKAPPLLISFAFKDVWEPLRARTRCREWVLDSGAFTAKSTGMTIDVNEFIEYAAHMKKSDSRLAAVFALDVIGDPVASLANAERMWEAGIEAIPCFHLGSDWKHLRELLRYPRIAIGGAARRAPKVKNAFAAEVFKRAWPKRIHGFGFGSQRLVMQYPWYSVDASSWSAGTRYAAWHCLAPRSNMRGTVKARIPNAGASMHAEIETFARLERAARSKWRHTWARVNAQ